MSHRRPFNYRDLPRTASEAEEAIERMLPMWIGADTPVREP